MKIEDTIKTKDQQLKKAENEERLRASQIENLKLELNEKAEDVTRLENTIENLNDSIHQLEVERDTAEQALKEIQDNVEDRQGVIDEQMQAIRDNKKLLAGDQETLESTIKDCKAAEDRNRELRNQKRNRKN